ncbi:hypothetical protein [Labilibaculum antarcticum]|uniref:Transposase IS200-like domain-containing protein n=1 Tax=Labilibaculum antarcticum TaxID=1717717 RepID=A0A1Y1CPQ8_9BACT|nr:hypothetical protein [Labilibaculum antarcticum]BAX81983.1 hypothetical protein ALGA_3691 [Labilibaculum antarcticum]
MQATEPLELGNYYHIYNRGINGCDLFTSEENYQYFLNLYEKHIDPIADTFAWVMMPNHFHILIRLKEGIVYKHSNADRSMDAVRFNEVKWETQNLLASERPDSVKIPKPHLHFSHFFNAYTKYINQRNNRHGSLFERPFKRKLINNESYLNNVLVYIHQNPVHHGFCEHPIEYGWSSYLGCISSKPTKIRREAVIKWFSDRENFKYCHTQSIPVDEMDEWLGI